MGMPGQQETLEQINWRLEIVRSNTPGKVFEVTATTAIAETLFYLDPDIPFANPSASIDRALTGFWRILQGTATLFAPSEWDLLSGFDSPFYNGGFEFESAAALADEYAHFCEGEDWCNEVLAIKQLLPKIRGLSPVEFEAVREVFALLRNLDPPPYGRWSLSQKLDALRNEPF